MIETHPEARTGVVPQVILHGFTPAGAVENEYGRSNIDAATNVTSFCTNVSWTHSISAPFETIELDLVFPGSVFQTIMPGIKLASATTRAPCSGFWVVLYLPNEKEGVQNFWSAIHWGYCSRLRVRSTTNPATGVQTVHVSISCESWAGLLKRNSMFLSPGSNYVRKGFSYDLAAWTDEWQALAKGAIGQPPGVTFSTVWPAIAQSYLPDSLLSGMGTYADWSFDGTASEPYGSMGATPDPESSATSTTVAAKCYKIGEVIKLVHDVETCAKFAPVRALNHKGVGGLGIPSAGTILPNSTTWAFLESTFFPTPYIECFPSLEWPFGLADGVIPLEAGRRLLSDSTEAAAAYVEMGAAGGRGYTHLSAADALLGERGDVVEADWKITRPAPFNGDFADPDFPLGEALGGACPVLIYRMRPTLFVPLNAVSGTIQLRSLLTGEPDETYYTLVAAPTASEMLGLNQTTQLVSAATNIYPNLHYNWGADEIYESNWVYSEDDRCNMLQVKTPWKAQSEFQDHVFSGVPVLNNADVTKHGLRMKTIEWPFMPAQAVAGTPGNIGDSMTAMNEEFWTNAACHGHGHFFGTGSVRGKYKPVVKAGHYAAFYWQSGETGSLTKWAPFVHAPSDDPEATPEDRDFPGFTAYIVSVTHSVSANPVNGSVSASTTMQLERVAVSEGASVVAFNYPPPAKDIDHTTPIFVDPVTGQVVAGTVTVNEDGTITFFPAPAVGGG